jgi:hypothetical protein
MRTLQNFQDLCEDVTISVKGETKTIVSKEDLKAYIAKVYGVDYVNRSQAKKLTKLTYLMGINTSAKVVKGQKKDYQTAILYLKPYKTAFGNSCPMGAPCADDCLDESGRVKLDIKEFKILRARYLKTVLFYVNRQYFNAWLRDEITAYSAKHGDMLMVRLNGTSDINPKLFGNPMEAFPSVSFYDYTKVLNRTAIADQYENYHLTYSYSGTNDAEADEAMNRGYNVSFVLDGPMPLRFNKRKVFTMDDTDLRPLDEERGAFGYLKLKGTLNGIKNREFVISDNDNRLTY